MVRKDIEDDLAECHRYRDYKNLWEVILCVRFLQQERDSCTGWISIKHHKYGDLQNA